MLVRLVLYTTSTVVLNVRYPSIIHASGVCPTRKCYVGGFLFEVRPSVAFSNVVNKVFFCTNDL